MKIFLFITLLFCQVIIFILPVFGKLYQENSSTSSYNLTSWGKALLIATGISLLTTIGWYLYSESQEEIKSEALKVERQKSDSMISFKVDSNRKVLFNDLSEALKKQMLKLDTVENAIVGVNDSNSGLFIDIEDPTLYILKNGVNVVKYGKGWKATFDITALGATLTNFNIDFSIIVIIENQRSYHPLNTLRDKHVLLQNTSYTTSIMRDNSSIPTTIFIRVKGNFTKQTNKIIYNEDKIFRYLPSDQRVYELLDYMDDKTRIEQNKKNAIKDIYNGEKDEWSHIFDLESSKVLKNN